MVVGLIFVDLQLMCYLEKKQNYCTDDSPLIPISKSETIEAESEITLSCGSLFSG